MGRMPTPQRARRPRYVTLTPFGAMGRDLKRAPVASKIALPTVGARPTMGVSPAPAAPHFLPVEGASFRLLCKRGRQRLRALGWRLHWLLCMRPSFCHPRPQKSTPPAPGAVGAALVVTQGRHKACPYRDMLNNARNKTVVLTVATVLAALTGSFLIVRRAKPQGAPSSRRAFIAHGLEKHFASEGDTGPVKVNHIPTPERVMAPGLRLQPSSPPKGRRGINIVRGCPYGQKRGPGTLH